MQWYFFRNSCCCYRPCYVFSSPILHINWFWSQKPPQASVVKKKKSELYDLVADFDIRLLWCVNKQGDGSPAIDNHLTSLASATLQTNPSACRSLVKSHLSLIFSPFLLWGGIFLVCGEWQAAEHNVIEHGGENSHSAHWGWNGGKKRKSFSSFLWLTFIQCGWWLYTLRMKARKSFYWERH